MSANAPTIFYPQVNPAPRIREEYITAWGGVFAEADNILKVTAWTDKLPATVYTATLEQIYDEFGNPSIGNYKWTASNIRLVAGVNRLYIRNTLTTGATATTEVSMLVDFVPPTIVATFPANASTGNSPLYQIRIRFSEDMDPSSADGIHISPDPGGYWYPWHMNATDFVYSVPGLLLSYGTKYTVTFDADVKDIIGNSTTSTGFSFTTNRGITPYDGISAGYNTAYSTIISEIPVIENDGALAGYLTPGIATPFRYAPYDGCTSGYSSVWGKILSEIPVIESDSSVFTTLTPGIANPFRYASYDCVDAKYPDAILHSRIHELPVVESDSYGNTILSPGLVYPFRQAAYDGLTTGYYFFKYNLTPLPWYPTVLDYEIMNYVTLEGFIHVMNGNTPVLEWSVPNAMRNRRIFYTCQFSRFVSFSKFMAFDSYQNVGAFKFSTDKENWGPMPIMGTKRNVGYVQFTSPAQMEGGLWYFRIYAGYKKVTT